MTTTPGPAAAHPPFPRQGCARGWRTPTTTAALAVLVAITTLGISACAAPARAPSQPAAQALPTTAMTVTFYAAKDNDPPGTDQIFYPTIHPTAGGTGTYPDPITFATDRRELAPGTRIYHPQLRKYFIMEDDCAECDTDWTRRQAYHIDLWTSPTNTDAVLTCENRLTANTPVDIEINPPATQPVDITPLYNDLTGKCVN